MSLNKVFIMGRVCNQIELRRTQNGNAVATLTVAVDRNGKDAGTDFVDVVCWKATAEFASKYLAKGRMVVVEGRLQSRKWQDKNGNTRTAWEVIADGINFADSKPKGGETHEPEFTEEEDPGFLPF